MFTGIIRHAGEVEDVRPRADGRRLTIRLGPLAGGLAPGDSVAVNGACLTVLSVDAPSAAFDVVAETLSRTNLGRLQAGSRVNLERPLTLDAPLDGHLVQGHVDGTAELKAVRRGGQWLVEFAAPVELTDQMVAKGSVALDGVSLTLVDVADGAFTVALVPATLAQTTLGALPVGTRVNVEIDLIGKYVRRYLQTTGIVPASGGVTLAKLKEAGFL